MTDHLDDARSSRVGLRNAVGLVERSLAAPASGRADAWAKDLAAELELLGIAIEQHIALTEAPDGLLEDIVRQEPRLAKRVERTRADHVTLRETLARTLAGVPKDGKDVDVIHARDLVVELLTGVVRHRHLGADLVYEAYNVDMEAGD
jgi:hypothetical protein